MIVREGDDSVGDAGGPGSQEDQGEDEEVAGPLWVGLNTGNNITNSSHRIPVITKYDTKYSMIIVW